MPFHHRFRRAVRKPAKRQALAILKARNVPVGTVIDVGVERATPELIAAFPDCKHVLFEPVAEYRESILQNYRRLDYELRECAVSSENGHAMLETWSVGAGRAITHSGLVRAPRASGDRPLRRVETVTLDGVFVAGRYAAPYLLKIDIDGGELAVLKGAAATLKDTSVVIIEAPKSQIAERLAAMKAAGFDLFDLAEPVYYDDAFWQCDAIFLRADLHRTCFRQLATDFDPALYVPFR